MTDNEKAAIAAGLWKPCQNKVRGYEPAPDMHDLANLWRALEGLSKIPGWSYRIAAHASCEPFCTLGISYKVRTSCVIPSDVTKQADTLAKAVFGALVAKYDAEHPA